MNQASRRRRLTSGSGNRLVSLAAAIIAVLAALGTLYSHHRSISGLSVKNQAILTQGRATDAFNAYEAKQVRYNIYSALLASDLVRNAENRARLEAIAESERSSSLPLFERAKTLEQNANADDERSQAILKSYEVLQFATTVFEVSIVFVSISALVGARLLLPLGCGLSAVGLVIFVIGLLQAR